jgi:ribosomal protein L37AE/L43A
MLLCMPACSDCGLTHSETSCPRCAKIDAQLGPEPEPSSLVNSLGSTEPPRSEAEVALLRFAAAEQTTRQPEEVECSRCAEKIKARAKVCRFCGAEFAGGAEFRAVVPEREVRSTTPSRRRIVAERLGLVDDRQRSMERKVSVIFWILVAWVTLAVLAVFLHVGLGMKAEAARRATEQRGRWESRARSERELEEDLRMMQVTAPTPAVPRGQNSSPEDNAERRRALDRLHDRETR